MATWKLKLFTVIKIYFWTFTKKIYINTLIERRHRLLRASFISNSLNFLYNWCIIPILLFLSKLYVFWVKNHFVVFFALKLLLLLLIIVSRVFWKLFVSKEFVFLSPSSRLALEHPFVFFYQSFWQFGGSNRFFPI